MRSFFSPLLLLLSLPTALTIASDPPAVPPPPALKLEPGEGHSISAEGARTVVNITSEHGIGRTTLRSADGSWPDQLILHLHLSGLEHFEIGNGEMSLATSFSSSKPVAARSTHVSPGAGAARLEVENQVTRDHPLSLNIRAVPEEKKEAAIPLDGYFEIEIPQEFLKAKPAELNIRWIDFYR